METLAETASKARTLWARSPLSSLFKKARQEPAAVALLLAFVAICLDFAIAPVLNTVTPALACFLLLLLLLRRHSDTNESVEASRNQSVPAVRVLVFVALHSAIIIVVLNSGAIGSLLPETARAAAKYLVLLPAAVLLPWKQWRGFDRVYRAEWIAAAVALFTIFPYRIFAVAWPWYCQGLGRLAHALARPFVTGLEYVPLPTPTLAGPHLDVRILFGCNGLEAIKLFQIVFAVMLVLDWTHLNKRRTIFAYFSGMAAMLLANAVRIALLAITGNLAPRLTVQNHLTLGWIFFACVAGGLIAPLYSWLMPRRAPAALATT